MKKYLIAGMAALLFMASPMPALASAPPPPVVDAAGGATGTLPFFLFTAGGIGLVVLIANEVDPWTPLFPSVVYDYPTHP